jgi:hypothetical protein
MITQILFTLFCTVFFCLGLYATSRDGYALFFLQKPFISAEYHMEVIKNKLALEKKVSLWLKFFLWSLFYEFGSPFIMCITCMGSMWGIIWFILTKDIWHHLSIQYLALNCFAASFIQTFIWKLYAKIDL